MLTSEPSNIRVETMFWAVGYAGFGSQGSDGSEKSKRRLDSQLDPAADEYKNIKFGWKNTPHGL